MLGETHKSSPAERPHLVDFLVVADHRRLDIGLRVWIGAIEVGLICISTGSVVFAELPGATGDVAVQLLASLSDARIVPESWTTRETNVASHWRTLVCERLLVESAARRQRLAAAGDALQPWSGQEMAAPEPDEPNSRAQRVAVGLLDWAAIMAYLDGRLTRAQELLERRQAIGSDDLFCRANFERLRLRRLEDELDASLAGSSARGGDE